MKSVFFDASVLFSALYSQTGGSNALVQKVKAGVITGITSETVIEELYENTTKLGSITSKQIDDFVVDNDFKVCESISVEEIQKWVGRVEEKDIHVLVGALSTEADYLVTLDLKHIHNEKTQSLFPTIQIVTPKELLAIL